MGVLSPKMRVSSNKNEKMMDLGQVFKLCRDYSGKRQTVFCRELGISQAYMSQLERGRRECGWGLVNKAVDVSGLNWVVVSWVLGSNGDGDRYAIMDALLGGAYGVRIVRVKGVVERVEKV